MHSVEIARLPKLSMELWLVVANQKCRGFEHELAMSADLRDIPVNKCDPRYKKMLMLQDDGTYCVLHAGSLQGSLHRKGGIEWSPKSIASLDLLGKLKLEKVAANKVKRLDRFMAGMSKDTQIKDSLATQTEAAKKEMNALKEAAEKRMAMPGTVPASSAPVELGANGLPPGQTSRPSHYMNVGKSSTGVAGILPSVGSRTGTCTTNAQMTETKNSMERLRTEAANHHHQPIAHTNLYIGKPSDSEMAKDNLLRDTTTDTSDLARANASAIVDFSEAQIEELLARARSQRKQLMARLRELESKLSAHEVHSRTPGDPVMKSATVSEEVIEKKPDQANSNIQGIKSSVNNVSVPTHGVRDNLTLCPKSFHELAASKVNQAPNEVSARVTGKAIMSSPNTNSEASTTSTTSTSVKVDAVPPQPAGHTTAVGAPAASGGHPESSAVDTLIEADKRDAEGTDVKKLEAKLAQVEAALKKPAFNQLNQNEVGQSEIEEVQGKRNTLPKPLKESQTNGNEEVKESKETGPDGEDWEVVDGEQIDNDYVVVVDETKKVKWFEPFRRY